MVTVNGLPASSRAIRQVDLRNHGNPWLLAELLSRYGHLIQLCLLSLPRVWI
jgi:hypothetical protein